MFDKPYNPAFRILRNQPAAIVDFPERPYDPCWIGGNALLRNSSCLHFASIRDRVPYIDPKIENAHSEQYERDWPGQSQREKQAGQPRNGLSQVGATDGEQLRGNIAGHDGTRAREQERKPRGCAAPGPEHGEGGKDEQQEAGIVQPMIEREHGKSGNGRERQPCALL